MEIAAALLERALANRMAMLGSSRGMRDLHLARIWSSLLKDTADLAGPAGEDGLALKAARRSLRLLVMNGVERNDNQVASVASWAMVAVHDLGHRPSATAWRQMPAPDAKGVASPPVESTNAYASPKWYDAVLLFDEGRYRAAADLLDWHLRDIGNETPPDVEVASMRQSLLLFYHGALAELGRRDAASATLQRERQSIIALAPGLGFPNEESRIWLVVTQAMMLADLEEDGAALDAFTELDTFDPAFLAALGAAALARMYRALLGGADDDIDLRAVVEATLTRLRRKLPAGPDRPAANAAGTTWHGSGLFCPSSSHASLDRWLARYFAPAIELGLRRARRDDARAVLDRWAQLAERRAPDGIGLRDTPIRSYAAGLIAAFRAELGPPGARDGHVAEARAHRQADLDANGLERAFAYRRAFALCGID